MTIRFNADEVLQVAARNEANAAAFYRKAAALHKAAHQTDFLLEMAKMEEGHHDTFMAMRAALPAEAREQTVHDPYLEAEMYLAQMADQHGGEGSAQAAQALTGKESLESLLRTSIGLEQKTIAFYAALKDSVPVKQGRDRIDTIIAEEKSHVVTLAREIGKLRRQ